MSDGIDLHLSCDIMQGVGAIVLGGGRGTRLYPLTQVRAKPAVPLAGRYRLVDIPLSNCIHSGITRIAVLTQFNSHSLNRHINQTYRFDNFSNGYVEVLSAEQTEESGDWFQGTADAVRKQMLHIRDLKAKYYLILSGDQLYSMDYRTMLETHLRKGADLTVAALPVTRDAAHGFGIMQVDAHGAIKNFVEKPTINEVLDQLVTPDKLFSDFGLKSEGRPYLASMGVYIFNAEVLEQMLANNPKSIDFGKEIIPHSLNSHKVYAHMFNGFWEDIGTVSSYFEVSMALTSANPPFSLHDPSFPIYTHARALPGVKIADAQINEAIICEGSRINGAVLNRAIIGIRSIIEKGAQIEESIILGAEYFEDEPPRNVKMPMGIGGGTRIERAIIDHNARIGKNCVIRGSKELGDFEDGNYSIRDGIVIVHKNAVIPDGTKIGA